MLARFFASQYIRPKPHSELVRKAGVGAGRYPQYHIAFSLRSNVAFVAYLILRLVENGANIDDTYDHSTSCRSIINVVPMTYAEIAKPR